MTAPFQHRIAIIGNPACPDTRFDDGQLSALTRLGFATIQLNIAWGARPGGEPLTLEDVVTLPGAPEAPGVAAMRAEIRRRAQACRAHGFRTLFHFGAPFVKDVGKLLGQGLQKHQAVEPCIRKPEVVEYYRKMLITFAEVCPEVEDILVYTYDQSAWLCSEFGECPRCRGVPLHERLPAFLHMLRDAWAAERPQGTFWWEPWELSAGQIYAVFPHLPDENFGMMLHSNIAEVMAAHPVDPWFRNLARLCQGRGIPAVGELFLTGANEEVEPLQNVATPRLVYQQLQAVRQVPGVAGVKEYFGTRPDAPDPNLAMAGLLFANPDLSLEEALQQLSAPFEAAAHLVRQAWAATADGYELFPWDFCWTYRFMGRRGPQHDWKNAFVVRGHLVDTPSWCSTRRTIFMTTENEDLHPWFYEDIGLRCQASAEAYARAVACYDQALPVAPAALQQDLRAWKEDTERLLGGARGLALHIQETLVAQLLRAAAADGALPESLLSRMRRLLERDVESHALANGADAENAAATMLRQFNADPAAWLQQHLR
jgi:hypothetical protein